MIRFLVAATFLLLFWVPSNSLLAQRRCGFDINRSTLAAQDPNFARKLEQVRAGQQAVADRYKHSRNNKPEDRTTGAATITIPVVFHIIVNQQQYQMMGSNAGILQRCDSQIAVLNRDYNAQNSDSVLIPSGWKHLFGNAGIHFGLAHTDPTGGATPGYEVKIITDSGITGLSNSYHAAKVASLGGLDPWDNLKYLNVWCINFADYNGLLGITVPLSFVNGSTFTDGDEGVCILYNTLGKRSSSTDYYPVNGNSHNYFDLGRTLTHEIGHFFEIWHVWGDDGGLCPWQPGGSTPHLGDIPPQADHTESNPTYNIMSGGVLVGTIRDICQDSATVLRQPIGIACLDYLDYTDDIGMHLFTPDQAAVMASMVSVVDSVAGENLTLTQNPQLLSYPAGTPQKVTLYPNPVKNNLTISIKNPTDSLEDFRVLDMMGRDILKYVPAQLQTNAYTVDVSGLPFGMYIVKCKFTTAIFTQKIMVVK
jgi:Secretion system C-terminal sorting domain